MSLSDEWDQITSKGPKRPKKQPAATVDTNRLKRDLGENYARSGADGHGGKPRVDFLSNARETVAREDTLDQARAGRIPTRKVLDIHGQLSKDPDPDREYTPDGRLKLRTFGEGLAAMKAAFAKKTK